VGGDDGNNTAAVSRYSIRGNEVKLTNIAVIAEVWTAFKVRTEIHGCIAYYKRANVENTKKLLQNDCFLRIAGHMG